MCNVCVSDDEQRKEGEEIGAREKAREAWAHAVL
jgi:hypothetical protein